MPLLSYFTIVGGALLACLMVGSLYFPVEPMREAREVHTPRIRVQSDKVTAPPIEIVSRATVSLPASTAVSAISSADVSKL